MYQIQAEEHFDAAHFLAGYEGKCRNIHGHRWTVVAYAQTEALCEDKQQRGMVMDFSELKAALKKLCDEMDHKLIYEAGSLRPATVAALKEEDFAMVEVSFRPTAENFAHWFFMQLKEKGFPMHRVEVYETPGNCAIYEE